MTLELSAVALVIALTIGVGLGIASAMRHNSIVDLGTMMIANVGVSMPVFWLGLMLAWIFGAILGWLPPSGRLTAGLISLPFYEAWGWSLAEGTVPWRIADFISNHFNLNTSFNKT